MRNKLVALLLGLALSGAAAGCSSGGSETAADSGNEAAGGPTTTTDPKAAISGAYDATVAAKTMRAHFTIEASGDTEDLDMTGTVDLDFEKGMARIKATMAAPPDYPPELGNELEIAGVLTDDAVYLDMTVLLPPEMAGILGGKRWFKEPLAGAEANGGLLGGGLPDPRAALKALEGFAGDVTVVGTEKVRGVETAHYKTDLSVKALLQALPEKERAQAKREYGSATSVPTELWVSNDGQLRRVKRTIKNARGTTVTTEEYYDFGTKFDIKVPPADEVIDDPALLGGGTTEG